MHTDSHVEGISDFPSKHVSGFLRNFKIIFTTLYCRISALPQNLPQLTLSISAECVLHACLSGSVTLSHSVCRLEASGGLSLGPLMQTARSMPGVLLQCSWSWQSWGHKSLCSTNSNLLRTSCILSLSLSKKELHWLPSSLLFLSPRSRKYKYYLYSITYTQTRFKEPDCKQMLYITSFS
jgi:hypothetical protein